MTKFLGNSLATVILSFALTAITMNWLINDDPEKHLLKPTLLNDSGESIESIDISYEGRSILLNVNLRRPISCTKAVELLRIESFEIRERLYSPTCLSISNSLIQIVYAEAE